MAGRCTRGADYAKQADVTRAMIYLADCQDAELSDDVGPAIRAAVRDTKKKARELGEITFSSDPAGVTLTLDALPDEPVITPATLWVKPGAYTVRYTMGDKALQKSVEAKAYSRTAIILDGGPTAPKPPRTSSVDFTEENAQEQHVGQPADVKRGSLMSKRYRGEADPLEAGTQLEDPLADRGARGPHPWIGVRLGGGIYDDSLATATWRPSIAATVRVVLAGPLFVAARLDWSRRGGEAVSGVATTSVGAGVGATLLVTRSFSLAALVQLRGELRFADERTMRGELEAHVNRVGAGAAAALELAFARTPLTLGLRLEQGLTELVPGARDRAAVVELGIDWR